MTERVYVWQNDVAGAAVPFLAYLASHRYLHEDRIVHKVFGQGIVTRVDGPKIEVLFQSGTKKLVHNPAGTEAPVAGPEFYPPEPGEAAPAPSAEPPKAEAAPAPEAAKSEPTSGTPEQG